jgi:hypothetical protein
MRKIEDILFYKQMNFQEIVTRKMHLSSLCSNTPFENHIMKCSISFSTSLWHCHWTAPLSVALFFCLCTTDRRDQQGQLKDWAPSLTPLPQMGLNTLIHNHNVISSLARYYIQPIRGVDSLFCSSSNQTWKIVFD